MRRIPGSTVPAIAAVLLAGACTVPSSTVKTTPATNGQAAQTTPAVPPPATTSKAAAVAKVGSAIDINGEGGVKLAITVVKVVDPAVEINGYSTVNDGNRYVAVQFRIKNTGSASYSDDPDINVAGIDASGQEYNATLSSQITAGQKLSSSVNVAPGDSALGFEVFELPKNQKLVKVQYKMNGGIFGDVAQWTIG